MGTSSSSVKLDSKTNWQRLVHFEDAKAIYVKEQSINIDSSRSELELRVLLDNIIAYELMKLYCKRGGDVGSYNLLVCWKVLQKLDSKRAGAVTLEQLFTVCGTLFSFTEGDAQEIFGVLRARTSFLFRVHADQQNKELPLLFVKCRRTCFECIFLMYRSFAKSPAFTEMCTALRTELNNVNPGDFEYLSKLGSGSYGVVLHCVKRSTGMHYAMKVQSKSGLLRHCQANPANVVMEMRANACCRHHYLTEVYYAFQTPTLAIMVMNICGCGDLNRSLRTCPNRRMPMDRVRFYVAEIISALQYLHANDLVYRDLKPGNVLLNSDGHIMLADFGSLADLTGSLADKGLEEPLTGEPKVPAAPVFDSIYALPQRIYSAVVSSPVPVSPQKHASAGAKSSDSSDSHHQVSRASSLNLGIDVGAQEPEMRTRRVINAVVGECVCLFVCLFAVTTVSLRRRSVSVSVFCVNVLWCSGTLEYMAPEMMGMVGAPFLLRGREAEGYVEAVDWWSLGGLVYKLLFGRLPFKTFSVDQLRRKFQVCMNIDGTVNEDAFHDIFGPLSVDPDTDPKATDFIRRLLCVDPQQRLGFTGGSERENFIRGHPFLETIDWDRLEKKELQPPYVPLTAEAIIPDVTGSFRTDDSFSPPPPESYTFKTMLNLCGKSEWATHGESTLQRLSAAQWGGLFGNFGNNKKKKDTDLAVDCLDERAKPPAYAFKPDVKISDEMQEYFAPWNYVSPSMIDREEIEYAKSKDRAGGRFISTVLGLGDDYYTI